MEGKQPSKTTISSLKLRLSSLGDVVLYFMNNSYVDVVRGHVRVGSEVNIDRKSNSERRGGEKWRCRAL